MRGLLLIGLTLFAATSALAQAPTDAEVIKRTEIAVADLLRDPDSAKFRGVQVSRKDGVTRVCGEVNARNQYGGYNGFAPFVADDTGFYSPDFLELHPGLYERFCD